MNETKHKTSPQSSNAYVYCNELRAADGTVLATFRTHWQAVAAMIRLSNPDFCSTGGDSPEALAIESEMSERLAHVAIA